MELEDTAQAPAQPPDGSRSPATDQTATAAAIGSIPPRDAVPMGEGELPAGRQLGHFRIERKLGAGGMGEVYLATDLALDRAVAIKVLPDHTARDPSRRDRLIREARAQARITHPNVGHIYFIGEDAGRLYFAMEYVVGETLAERMTRGPLAPDTALELVRAAALGLREAQRNGFTHRDVKPSNLMVDAHGVLKVLDFGLAAGGPSTAGDGAPALAGGVPVTQTSLGGTPLYMAPEQARGDAVDFRADIYALGATLYHLVSGHAPFTAESVDELRTLHASAPRPALVRRGQPRSSIAMIRNLCIKMMAPAVADRFASYDDLLRELDLASQVRTRPAGFWARGVAVFVDLIVVGLVLGLTISLPAELAGYESFDLNALIFSALAVYSVIATARFGRTLGDAMLELEVVDVTTERRPSWSRAVIRQLCVSAVLMLVAWLDALFRGFGLADAIWIGGLILALLYASARTPGKRAWWDRASGTMMRYRTTRAG